MSNLNICKASCCKTVGFNVSGVGGGNILNFPVMTASQKHYNELHGFKVRRLRDRTWELIIPKKLFDGSVITWNDENSTIIVPAVCSALTDDNKCSLHGTDEKPYQCSDLNQETAHKYFLTEGCIYK